MVSEVLYVDDTVAHADVGRTEAVDFAIALTSGPNAWITPDAASTPLVKSTLFIALGGILMTTTLTIVEVLRDHAGRALTLRLAMVACVVLAMATLASSAVAAILRQQHHGGRQSMLPFRIAAMVVFGTIWISTVPAAFCALIWPIGLFAGAEAALTARLIGHDRPMRTLYANYLLSSLHLGAISAVLAAAVLVRTDRVVRLATAGVGSLEVAAIASILTYGVLRRLFEQESQFVDSIRERERSGEFRRRAHWIHDDVCADLRELRVKLASTMLDQRQVFVELDHLDDRLRERQLDELLNGGGVAAAEVLQSAVRRAQNAGVTITEVPRFEAASVMIGGETAQLLRRCVAGFVSNAIQAGATTLGLHLSSDQREIVLAVSDDAGGFDLADAPAGRGLASLREELGADRLTSVPRPGGTTMVARIPLR